MTKFIIPIEWKWTIKLDPDKNELKSLKQLQWFIELLNTWIFYSRRRRFSFFAQRKQK